MLLQPGGKRKGFTQQLSPTGVVNDARIGEPGTGQASSHHWETTEIRKYPVTIDRGYRSTKFGELPPAAWSPVNTEATL